MKRVGLQLLALLVVSTLVAQGVSTATKRLWTPAHYHLSPDTSMSQSAPMPAVTPGPVHRHGGQGPHAHHRRDPKSRSVHSHAGIDYHRHERGTTGVVYVADPEEPPPAATTPRPESDHFWGDLPSWPSLALKHHSGDPPPPAPMRLAQANDVPLRPPC